MLAPPLQGYRAPPGGRAPQFEKHCITESEKALNTTLKGIAEWAENLKLTINADKTNYCIFSTDRRHRSSYNANIKIQKSQIKKVDLPTYLGVTLDPELRFSKHIKQTINKALEKLNILRKLCGTSWGSRPQTLKALSALLSDRFFRICDPQFGLRPYFVKRKLDSVQHRAAKIIIEQCHQPIMKRPNKTRFAQKAGANLPLSSSLINYAQWFGPYLRRVFDKWKHSHKAQKIFDSPT
ncbi:reverse transcriptase domain-containing protein [Trichonephila clavipes]|nr:reverse transcriptase domain-containing protein [Trichonephila clavipes]